MISWFWVRIFCYFLFFPVFLLVMIHETIKQTKNPNFLSLGLAKECPYWAVVCSNNRVIKERKLGWEFPLLRISKIVQNLLFAKSKHFLASTLPASFSHVDVSNNKDVTLFYSSSVLQILSPSPSSFLPALHRVVSAVWKLYRVAAVAMSRNSFLRPSIFFPADEDKLHHHHNQYRKENKKVKRKSKQYSLFTEPQKPERARVKE